jgi:hypothetical protein
MTHRAETPLTRKRDAAGVCVMCGKRPQQNGNWCWPCSDRAASGQIPWNATPEEYGDSDQEASA